MRRAARVDSTQAAIVKALRGYGCNVIHTHMVGGGFPDLVVTHSGRTGLIEVKSDGKERDLTADQIKFWDAWTGGPIAIVTDVAGALRFARALAFEGMEP